MKYFRIFSKAIFYIKKYKWRYIGGFSALIITDVFVMLTPWLLKISIDSLGKPDALNRIYIYALLIIAVGFGTAVFRFLWRFLIVSVSRTIEYDLRNDFFKHIQLLHAGYFNKTRTGDLMSRATNDMQAVREFLAMGLLFGVDTVLVFSFALFMILKIDPALTLWVLIPVPIMAISIKFITTFIYKQFEKVQEQLSTMSTISQENFSGIRVVKAYAKESYETDKFKRVAEEYFKRFMRLTKYDGMFNPFMGLMMSIGIIIVLFKGGERIITGRLSYGDFVAFNGYVLILSWPTAAFGWVMNLLQRGTASMSRINEIFDTKPDITDRKNVDFNKKTINGDIEFKNVSFSYSKDEPLVLKNINFKVPQGITLAVVGATGSGKSTLLNLIPRLFDPTAGRILIDGIDITNISLSILRQNIGIVTQEPFLFSDTIKENIAFGRPDVSLEEIKKAAKLAQIADEIEGFPHGYDTVIGERGVTLSGGQKQRVAIARALLISPPVLLLDDALSSVDSSTEKEIVHNLHQTMKGKTAVIISHRISTIKIADLIVVLDNGEVAEKGSHSELLKLKGAYASFYEKQKIKELIEKQ